MAVIHPTASHFYSLGAPKGKFIIYLDIFVISNLFVSKQLKLPTSKVLMKAEAPVLFPPPKNNTTDPGQSGAVPNSNSTLPRATGVPKGAAPPLTRGICRSAYLHPWKFPFQTSS